MIAWFRVDASLEMGAGHLMRCLALAQVLTEQHIECRFIVRGSTTSFCKERVDWQWQIVIMDDGVDIIEEPAWLKLNLSYSSGDILVLDGYHFKADYISALELIGIPVVLFDDTNERGVLKAQVVINGAENAKSLGYELTIPGATKCLGERFRLLRSEFRSVVPIPVNERHSMAIVMGGSDPKNLTISLLTELQKQNHDSPVRVLVSGNYPRLEELKSLVSQCSFAIQLVINGPDLADIFNHSTLVISAAGGTQFELLAMHTPAMLLVVADNQVNATQQSETQGWCEYFDCRQKPPLTEIVKRVKQMLATPDKLVTMQECARQHADYEGAERILDEILKLKMVPELD